MSNRNPLLIVSHNTSDFQSPGGGGGKKKVFDEVNAEFQSKLVGDLNAVNAIFESQFNNNTQLPGIAKVILKEKALAKSHRPSKLLSNAGCPIVGVGKIGELYISVTKGSLQRLARAIETSSTKEGIANISTIKEIIPYQREDASKIKSPLQRESKIKCKLFKHGDATKDRQVKNSFSQLLAELNIPPAKTLRYSSSLELLEVDTVDQSKLQRIASFIGTQSVSFFPKYHLIRSNSIPLREALVSDYPDPETGTDYPVVGVIDSGIKPGEQILSKWIIGTENFIPARIEHSYSHGTFVSGLVILGKHFNHGNALFPDGEVKILDVAALPSEGITENELLAVLEEVIPKYPNVKVWNLSLGAESPCDEESFSDLGMALDELQDKHGVMFVIAAGNYQTLPLRRWPNTINDGSDRISSPGDSIRAITVGSVAHTSVASSGVETGFPSPFSRRGPGPSFIPKPELTHFGGNCDIQGRYNQTGVLSLNTEGFLAEDIGTSFATPLVSNLLAQLTHKLGSNANRNLAKALLIHSAAIHNATPTSEDLKYFGFGKPPSVAEILSCADWQATSIFQLGLVSRLEFVKDFPIPPCLITPDGKTMGEFTVTLVYDPATDPNFGSEYCRSNIDISLGTYDLGADGKRHQKKQIPLAPTDIDQMYEEKLVEHGFKWSPVKVYKRTLVRGVESTDWRLQVSVTHRSQFEEARPQAMALIVTIADPERTKPVFSEFKATAISRGWTTTDLQVREYLRTRARG